MGFIMTEMMAKAGTKTMTRKQIMLFEAISRQVSF
jgi:hypothetical protein